MSTLGNNYIFKKLNLYYFYSGGYLSCRKDILIKDFWKVHLLSIHLLFAIFLKEKLGSFECKIMNINISYHFWTVAFTRNNFSIVEFQKRKKFKLTLSLMIWKSIFKRNYFYLSSVFFLKIGNTFFYLNSCMALRLFNCILW